MDILINSLGGGGAERQVALLTSHFPVDKVFALENEISYEIDRSKLVALSRHNKKTSAIWKMICLPLYCWRLRRSILFSTPLGARRPPRCASHPPRLRNFLLARSDALEKDTSPHSNECVPIVLSFLERSNFVNILSKLFFRHKAFVSVRIQPSLAYDKGLKRFEKLLIRWLYPFAEKIIVNSQGIKHDLVTHFRFKEEKIVVIENALGIEDIVQRAALDLEEELKPIFKNPVIITVGRHIHQKGQWQLIRVFSELKKHIPALRLVIVGEGPLTEELRGIGRELKLREGEDLYFLPFRKNPFQLIARASLFVLPSLYEGFPNVLIEAMACGTPVASTDCWSGPREILAPDTGHPKKNADAENTMYGVLLPLGDFKDTEKKWVHALLEILKKPSEETIIRAKTRIKDFSLQTVLEKWRSTIRL